MAVGADDLTFRHLQPDLFSVQSIGLVHGFGHSELLLAAYVIEVHGARRETAPAVSARAILGRGNDVANASTGFCACTA
jgi:hypothetical protein